MTPDLVKRSEGADIALPNGAVATTMLTLYRPDRDYDGRWKAPAYSTFANANKTVIFISRESAPRPLWNETQQRYESMVKAEAISVGADYNLPAGTITYMVSEDLEGFTHVVNETDAVGGQDSKTV